MKKKENVDLESQEKIEKLDQEGKRYLEYKSISGMDLVPRIRQPTPEKKREKSKSPTNIDCEGCMKYKKRLDEVNLENKMLKEELLKVQNQLETMRVQQKITNSKKSLR